MQLCFENGYSAPLSIAVSWWNPDGCGDAGNWGTKGWWNLDPGQGVSTDVWTANRYFCYYAEAVDGEVWAGPYGPMDATYAAFESCIDIGSTADDVSVGLRVVDAGWWHWAYVTYTLTLD